MMNERDEAQKIAETVVLEVGKDKAPGLSQDLLQAIFRIEQGHRFSPDDRLKAIQEIRAVVQAAVSGVKS